MNVFFIKKNIIQPNQTIFRFTMLFLLFHCVFLISLFDFCMGRFTRNFENKKNNDSVTLVALVIQTIVVLFWYVFMCWNGIRELITVFCREYGVTLPILLTETFGRSFIRNLEHGRS